MKGGSNRFLCAVILVTAETTADGLYGYTTNTHSGTISGFSVSGSGELALLNPSDGVTADLGEDSSPGELTIIDSFLYVVDFAAGEFRGGLTATTVGIASC